MFKKKYPPRAELTVKQEWSIFQGMMEGKPVFIRLNKGLKSLAKHPEFSHQVGIAVPLNNPNEHGLPQNDEAEQLNKIEDQITASLEPENESLFAGAISTNNMREFVFYTSSPDNVIEKFKTLQESISTHQIQLMIQADKDWLTYKNIGG